MSLPRRSGGVPHSLPAEYQVLRALDPGPAGRLGQLVVLLEERQVGLSARVWVFAAWVVRRCR